MPVDEPHAVRLTTNLYEAATTGTTYETTATDVDLVATEGDFLGMTVCSNSEEWPTAGPDAAWWVGTLGAVDLRFEPDQAWPDEATWDGTELGDLDVTVTGLVLEPFGLGVGTFVVPDVTLSGRVSTLDLPA